MTTTAPRILTLTVPLPPPQLTANRSAHQHWRYRQQAAKEYRELCGYEYWRQLGAAEVAPFPLARLLLRFAFCGKRNLMDCDGALTAAKPAIDALIDCRLLASDAPQYVPEMVTSVGPRHPRACGCGGSLTLTVEELR